MKSVIDDYPVGWNKTIADLTAECTEQRRPVGPLETDWARAYERSLLRKWARFPVDGDIYEAVEETPVSFLKHWAAPFTDGGSGVLPKGTKIRVEVLSPEPIAVCAHPIDQGDIEALLIAATDRANDRYRGFSLWTSTSDLNKRFRLLAK